MKESDNIMKIIVVCGSGVATSTVITAKINELLAKNQMKAEVTQCGINELNSHLEGGTLVVTSLGRLNAGNIPVIVALPYITGVGVEQLNEKIKKTLMEADS